MVALINLPSIQNPLLRQVEAKVEEAVGDGKARADYLKVVVAGMRAALANGPQSMMAKLRDAPDPVKLCALGAVALVMHMRQISQGTMPPNSIISGATTLMLQALDFADHAGLAKVDNEALVRATHILTNALFQAFGITLPMLNKLAATAHGVMQDPGQMQAIQQHLEKGGA
jgi:hypothetical protein